MMEKIKVMLVDDQKLVLDGIKTILNFSPLLTVVETSENGLDALEKIENKDIDVVLMDIRMPKMNGVDATKKIKEIKPDVKILVLTTFDDDEYIIKALSYGASGYLLKDIDSDDLIKAIKDVYEDRFIMPGKIAMKLAKKINKDNNKVIDNEITEDFTSREMDVIKFMKDGLTNSEIASSMFISEGTVKNYISNIYSKIGVSNRSKAIKYFEEMI